MNEKMKLVFCPCFIHDHENYTSRPCWGRLKYGNDTCTCGKCGAEYVFRKEWPLPVLFPDYHQITSNYPKVEELERKNFSNLNRIGYDWYNKVKEIPLPKQKVNVIKENWREYIRQVANAINVDINFEDTNEEELGIGITEGPDETYVYESKVFFYNFDDFVNYYRPVFRDTELMSDYIIACFAHEIGHLCPPTGGALDYLLNESPWLSENKAINGYLYNIMYIWDESLANLNALAFYPTYSDFIRYISISLYVATDLFKYPDSENTLRDELDYSSDDTILDGLRNIGKTFSLPNDYIKYAVGYWKYFLWIDITRSDIMRDILADIKLIDDRVKSQNA